MDPVRTLRFGLLGIVSALSAALLASTAFAAIFPDVPDSDPHKTNIELLVGLKVINGNPDGTFAPNREVNRAEFLAMTYRAIGRKPATAPRHLFKDVVIGSWYQLIVDDAAAAGFVQGYSDSTFRPEQSVKRVEALKIMAEVMGMSVPELTQNSRDVVRFSDVPLGAWYVKYLYHVYASGILPVPGQDGNLFHPDRPLLRKEAASYIANALRYITYEGDKEEAAASSAASPRSASSQAASAPGVSIKYVPIPFGESDVFSGKQPKVYRFALSETTTLRLAARLDRGDGGVSCNLFRIEQDGFAYEYYIGYQQDKDCSMTVTLGKGDYQLQVQSLNGGGDYTVSGGKAMGDKNDGFTQAVNLSLNSPRVGILDIGDYMDFYTFKLQGETNLRVELTAAAQLDCSVWPMEGVELESFTGPECNSDYDFPAGTYVVGVGHAITGPIKQTYTLRLK